MSKKDSGGWFKKVASSFVEFEDEKKPITEMAEESQGEEQAEAEAPASKQTTSSVSFETTSTPTELASNPVGTVTPAQMATGQFDQGVYDSLLQEIEKHDLDGVDYLEFTKAKKSLEGTGLSEQQQTIAAFNTLKATGNITKDSLLNTADHYIGVLEQEKSGFDEAIAQETQAQVTARQDSIVSKEQAIQDKLEQINQLNAEIQEEQVNITTLKTEIVQEEARIKGLVANFDATFAIVKSGIETDKSNISALIAEATTGA